MMTGALQGGRAARKASMTLLLVLAAESVLFGLLLMIYLYMRTNQLRQFTPQVLHQIFLPGVNTTILAVSALLAEWAQRGIRRNNQSTLRWGLGASLVLGLIFIAGQVVEFQRSGMAPGDNAYGGIYFTLIGFHAVHVLAGVVFLAINWTRARLSDFSAHDYSAVQIGVWFWFYVTGVWFVLFIVLYLI